MLITDTKDTKDMPPILIRISRSKRAYLDVSTTVTRVLMIQVCAKEWPTAIFRCADWPILSAGDPYFGWRELLTGRSEIHEIPGVHEEIFREPNVRVLAQKLSACLQNAQQAETPAYDSVSVGD